MSNSTIKFRKKPVVIEAIQWDGINLTDMINFVGDKLEYEYYDAAYQAGVAPPVIDLKIHTLEGDMQVNNGDFVIKGVKGEYYPCKPDIFKQTYEKVDSPPEEPTTCYVINGWVSRDECSGDESNLFVGQKKPKRLEGEPTGFGMWCDFGEFMALPAEMFPELSYNDEPVEVEIIIKPKK